jgi:hypothetical protein
MRHLPSHTDLDIHSRAFLVQRVQRVEAIVWSVGWLG